MATKTSSKTATRKPAARKTDAAQKPVDTAKAKVSAKKLKTEADTAHVETAPPARPHAQQPSTPKVAPQTAPAPHHEVERVSLIDKKKPRIRNLTSHQGEDLSRQKQSGIRIGPVYTPPALRGRGYASACVARLSQDKLDEGRTFCFLYTDLSNPTSNHIYQEIGYEPVCDVADYRFTVPAEAAQ